MERGHDKKHSPQARFHRFMSWLARFEKAEYGCVCVVLVGMIGFGAFMVLAGLCAICQDVHAWRFALGALLCGGFLMLAGLSDWRYQRRRHRLVLNTLGGDVEAALTLRRLGDRNAKWVWRINGPLVFLMCVFVMVFVLLDRSLCMWGKILGEIGLVAGALLVLWTSLRAWLS